MKGSRISIFSGTGVVTAWVAALCVAATAVISTAGCTDRAGAIRALETAGYKNIQAGGYSWTGCGEGDDYATKFTATSPNGHPASGAVCRGVFKGNAIRTE